MGRTPNTIFLNLITHSPQAERIEVNTELNKETILRTRAH